MIESKYILNYHLHYQIAQTLVPLPQISKGLIWCHHLIWQLTKNVNRKNLKVLESETYF